MIGKGMNRRQPIHVDDLVDALWLAGGTEAARGQVFVVAGSEVLTTVETVNVISETLGRNVRSWHLPMWPFLWLAWTLAQPLGRVGIQPPLHRRRLDFFRKSFLFNCEKAATVLKFVPKVSFVDGAKETAEWYQSKGLL